VVVYIEEVPNRNSPPAVFLRESYREDGKIKKITLANLSSLSEEIVDNIKLALTGAKLSINETVDNSFVIIVLKLQKAFLLLIFI
jgi:hypothetical protein